MLCIPPEGVGIVRVVGPLTIMPAMATVLHFSKRLTECPQPGTISGIELRHFRDSEDIRLWLELRHRAFARGTPGILQWTAEDFTAEFLARAWWSPERIWFAVAADSALGEELPVGTVALADREVGRKTLPAVHWLAVLPGWRRRGVGRLLLENLEAHCWRQGHREVFLETHAGWTAARRLYEELGYRPAE